MFAFPAEASHPIVGTELAGHRHCSDSGIAHDDRSCDCVHPDPATGHVHHGTEGQGVITFPQRTRLVAYVLEGAFLCVAIVLLIMSSFQGLHQVVGDLAISFVAILTEAVPFMLLGSVIGGLIEVFIPQAWVQRSLGTREYTGVLIGAGLGILFPVCECAIVPVVRRLLHKGVPLSAAVAFLLGGPIVNPLVAASTWLAYRADWTVVITRMSCGYIIAVSVALTMQFLFRRTNLLVEGIPAESASACSCCGHEHPPAGSAGNIARFWAAMQHACDDFFEVGKFLVIGAFVAAFARTAIGMDALGDLFASPLPAIIMMMGLAIALNLCSETDAFIAAGFQGILPYSAQMAFMVLGPMLDAKLFLMYLTLFRKRVIVTLSLLTFASVLVAMMFLQYALGG